MFFNNSGRLLHDAGKSSASDKQDLVQDSIPCHESTSLFAQYIIFCWSKEVDPGYLVELPQFLGKYSHGQALFLQWQTTNRVFKSQTTVTEVKHWGVKYITTYLVLLNSKPGGESILCSETIIKCDFEEGRQVREWISKGKNEFVFFFSVVLLELFLCQLASWKNQRLHLSSSRIESHFLSLFYMQLAFSLEFWSRATLLSTRHSFGSATVKIIQDCKPSANLGCLSNR